MDAFLSFIGLWPLKWAPRCWAICWGQLLAINDNTALFALIGATYGGDGRINFALPDFRGRVPLGYGNGIGLLPNELGFKGGCEAVKLSQDQLAAHRHAATLSSVSVEFKASAQAGTESIPGANDANTLGATSAGMGPGNKLYNLDTPTVTLAGVSASGGTVAVQDTGQNQFHENRQPYLVTNYIMCMQGIFPPRE